MRKVNRLKGLAGDEQNLLKTVIYIIVLLLNNIINL